MDDATWLMCKKIAQNAVIGDVAGAMALLGQMVTVAVPGPSVGGTAAEQAAGAVIQGAGAVKDLKDAPGEIRNALQAPARPPVRSGKEASAEERAALESLSILGIGCNGLEAAPGPFVLRCELPEGADPGVVAGLAAGGISELYPQAGSIRVFLEKGGKTLELLETNRADLQAVRGGAKTLNFKRSVVAEPHKLSACFQSAVNTFNAAVKAGKGLETAGADAQAVVEKMCPNLDFTGLELSAQATKCKGDFVACTAAAKDSATCKRALLLCIAATPDARVYKLEAMQMNIKVDRAGLLSRATGEAATADSSGRDIGTLKVQAEDGKFKKANWESKPIGVDFSSVAPDVGKGEVTVNLGLKDLPDSAQLKFTAKRDDDVKKSVEQELGKKNLKLLGVAFNVDLQTDMQVKDATFQVKCNKAWADKHGTGKVKMVRQSGGATEVLETKFMGYEGDLAIFETTSPGLSVFSLAAVEPASAAPPAKSPGFEAVAALAALAVVTFLHRRR